MKQIYILSFLCFLLFNNYSFSQSTLKYRDALDFDGYDDRVTIQHDDAFDFSEGTVEAWVQPKLLSGANMVILGNRGEDGTRYSIHMNANTIGLWNGESYLTVYLETPFRVGAWYHIAAAIGENSTGFYVDGEYVGSTENGMGSATGLPIQIGNTDDYLSLVETYNGTIDEVKFWNGIRTEEEIKNDMYDTTGTGSSLVAYYKLNESLGDITADATGNSRNGVLYDFALIGDRSNWIRDYTIGAPVAVDATLIASDSFTANWEAPVGDTVTSYLLDVATDLYFTNPLPGYEQMNVGNVLSYSVTELSDSQNYYYRVRAIKEGVSNAGPYSNTIAVSTLHHPTQKLFVNAGATEGMNNGTSWENAFVKLEDALSSASSSDTVWVAKGIYQPKENESYSLKEGVKVFGGFSGTETAFENRVLLQEQASVLKGNNSHVFMNSNLSMQTELDGFTISDGYHQPANEEDIFFNGGGMYNINSSFVIRNCRFANNKAGTIDSAPGSYSGGAMYNESSSPSIINCLFEGNSTRGDGGAIFNSFHSSPLIENSIFSHNYSTGVGGAIDNTLYSGGKISGSVFFSNSSGIGLGNLMYNYSSETSLINCTITGNYNSESSFKQLITNIPGSSVTIGNSIITDNASALNTQDNITVSFSLIDFFALGDGNIVGENPMFINISNPAGNDGIWGTSDDGLQLQSYSPAVNAGNNDMLSEDMQIDLLGNKRMFDETVDIGSYEHVESALPVTLASFKAVNNNCAVQVNWKAAQETGVEKYTVEKSSDGILFIPVADVVAKKTPGASYAYNYNSNNESTLYFRLKISDKSGKVTYSAIEKVMLSCTQPHIAMTPNPVKNVLMITNLTGASQVQVYNASGQQVVSVKTNNSQLPVTVASLPNGIYMVRVINNSKVVSTQKIMKN